MDALEPLPGGFSGEVFASGVGSDAAVVRIYAGRRSRRDRQGRFCDAPAEIEAALLALVRGLVPVPRVLELRRGAGESPAILVTQRLPGVPAITWYAGADAAGREALGGEVGRIAATLAGMPMRSAGVFTDATLQPQPFGGAALDLLEWLAEQLDVSPEGPFASAYEDLVRLCERAQELIDRVDRACLVHGDFNLRNLLVHPETGRVIGVVDWEFAHAGHPAADVGNLLRFLDARADQPFIDAVLSAYLDRHPGNREELVESARAVDLYALIDLAGRAAAEPGNEIAAAARGELLARAARQGSS